MFADYFTRNLKEGEELQLIVRKHWASFIWPMIKSLFFLVLPFCFIFFLLRSWWGAIIFFAVLIFAVTHAFYQWLIWYFDSLIVTNMRLIHIDQKGLFRRSISEANIINVQNVTYEIDGLLASFFDYGNLVVATASGSAAGLKILSIPDPREVQELIMNLQSKNRK